MHFLHAPRKGCKSTRQTSAHDFPLERARAYRGLQTPVYRRIEFVLLRFFTIFLWSSRSHSDSRAGYGVLCMIVIGSILGEQQQSSAWKFAYLYGSLELLQVATMSAVYYYAQATRFQFLKS